MPGKSQKQKYGEFRVFVEWRRRGKWAIRPEFQPSLAAWLLMIGKKYERMAAGMRDRLAVETVPGLRESVATMETCIRHTQLLLNSITDHFDNEDWQHAVAEICRLMDIRPSSAPLEEVPPGQFEHLISEPISGSDTSGADPAVQLGTGAGASSSEPARVDGSARRGGVDPAGLPSTEGHGADDAPGGHEERGAAGDRRERSRPGDDRAGKRAAHKPKRKR